VGEYRPNGFRLYDMHGNVYEWCQDWYDEDYYGSSPANDPAGPSSGSSRVSRGGSWCYGPSDIRSANRNWGTPDDRDSFVGFRVVVECE
jgi:formylglycine-generating enzyme